jgi:hypothetical protein
MTTPSLAADLADIEARLARDPDDIELRYALAGLLTGCGRAQDAQREYMATIARDPTHFGALNDLGTLLFNTNYRSAARVAYAEAVKHHPDNPIGRINLANALLADELIDEARVHYQAALDLAPDHPDANQGMANLLQGIGEADLAETHRQRSYRARTITTQPYCGAGQPHRALLLVSAVGGNVPTRLLLDDTVFAISTLAVEAYRPEMALPPHDLVFNAVGDADLCGPALDAVEQVLMRTRAPLINPPALVRQTGRVQIAGTLAAVPGVITPKVVAVARDRLEDAARGFAYPLLLRSIGFHAGRYFRKVQIADDLTSVAAELPGRELLLIECLDARDPAGFAHKYRVMMIDGRLYPLHLALSRDWKVHYFTADMQDHAEHRALEEAFLDDMTGVLGSSAMQALSEINDRLGLDYAGVDFALNGAGEVLLFEANATMVVNPPEADPRWDYRRGPINQVLEAARAMLAGRANGRT